MRVVLDATGYNPVLAPFVHHRPSPLFRIADKPILVHIIERLQTLGVRHFELILNHLPQMIEECVGEGHRWGIHINYHLARDASRPFSAITPAAYQWSERTVLMGHTDTLPKLHPRIFEKHSQEDIQLFFHGSRGWIGWGLMPVSVVRHIDREWAYEELPAKLTNYIKTPISGVMLSVKTPYDWLMSNHRLLDEHTPKSAFPTTARMIEPGIWVSRAVVLHPSVELRPPVFIGESCQIMEDAHLGPDVVIENQCIIDKKSSVMRSLICQHSYVGEGLEIYRSIVDQHTLLNLALGTSVNIPDDFILCHVASPVLRGRAMQCFESFLAFLILMLFSPLVAGATWRYGLVTCPKVALPADEESYHWTLFQLLQFRKPTWGFLSRLLILVNVVKGRLHFVGLRPRSVEELDAMPVEQRRFILEGRSGWIAVTEVEREASEEVVESLYVKRQRFFEDLKLAWRFFFL